ncbi:MAG: glycosyltransferase [Candidatus Aureabacteria bacterium]|nr:glycosyltransferase [Candidatus Auribacterota bacterium]
MRKSPVFSVTVLWLFSLVSLYFSPRLLSFIFIAPNWYSLLGILLFVLFFNLFFFYEVYNILAIIFSRFSKNNIPPPLHINPFSINEKNSYLPPIALLYLTRNDFNQEACLSCLNQDYPDYKVFILDDSSPGAGHKKIDAFISDVIPSRMPDFNRNKIQVIRRENKTGFKAGNMNNALRLIHDDFKYFAVSDSDGILPVNFLSSLLPYFQADESIGFVQACCSASEKNTSVFASDMALQISIHWKYFMPYRNSSGFVMFYGHSALIKMEVWEKINGLPEVVSEDLAFSARIREIGYQGILAANVWTGEDIPQDYPAFRKRHEKWVRGTAEFFRKNFLNFICSENIPWFEKADLLASGFSMLMSAPFIFFILLIAFFLPFFFQAFNLTGAMFNLPVASAGKHVTDYLSGLRYNMHWTTDFYVLIALGLLYPVIPAFMELRKQPMKCLNYLFVSTGIYTSLTLSSTLSIISYLITGMTFFPITGDKTDKTAIQNNGFLDFKSNSLKVQIIEFTLGIALFYVSFSSHNLWFIPIAIGSFLALLLLNARKYDKIKYLLYLPFLIQLILLILIGKNMICIFR